MSKMSEFNEKVIQEFRANGGKVGGQFENMQVLLLTATGAKTGRRLTRPLVYTEDGDRIVIIASYAGSPTSPPWYFNLLANPEATVEVGDETFQVRAAATAGKERQRLYDQQAAQMPVFADYQKKTTRRIPVLVLTRLD